MSDKEKFDQIQYVRDYNAEHYERFTLLMPKGIKDELKAKAKAEGKSLSSYILDIIKEHG